MSDERAFTGVALSRAPGRDCVWAHRRWLVERMRPLEGGAPLMAWVDVELAVCTAAADRRPRNYYAWAHRRWVLCGDDGAAPAALAARRRSDLVAVRRWCAAHVSDHSGLHYCAELLRAELGPVPAPSPRLRGAVEAAPAAALVEREPGPLDLHHWWAAALLARYPEQLALWTHVRQVLAMRVDAAAASLGGTGGSMALPMPAGSDVGGRAAADSARWLEARGFSASVREALTSPAPTTVLVRG